MNLRSCIKIQTLYVNGLLMAQEFSFPSNPNAGRANRAQFTQQVSWDSWRLIFFFLYGGISMTNCLTSYLIHFIPSHVTFTPAAARSHARHICWSFRVKDKPTCFYIIICQVSLSMKCSK